MVGWARPILDIVFDGVSDTVDYQAKLLLGKNFHRFQARLDEGSDDMDDITPANLRVLRLHAEQLIAESADQLSEVAKALAR